MKASNLGDSGFLLVRYNPDTQRSFVLLESRPMQHSFNTPF